MAAPKGNKNGVGNKGGHSWGKGNREKAAKVKGLALDYIIKVFAGNDEELKKQIVLKIATACLPQEVTGENGEPIKITFDPIFNAVTRKPTKNNSD